MQLPRNFLSIPNGRIYRVFIKYCVFLYNVDFSELSKFWCSAGVWPAIVYTHWHQERPESGIYFKSSKNTIFITIFINALYRMKGQIKLIIPLTFIDGTPKERLLEFLYTSQSPSQTYVAHLISLNLSVFSSLWTSAPVEAWKCNFPPL